MSVQLGGRVTDNDDNIVEPNKESLWEIWWNVQRSIRYHNYRHAFFESYSRAISGLNILLSSAAGASILKVIETSDAKFAMYLMGGLAFINTIDLVYGTAKRSGQHRELRNKFIDIEKRYLAGRRKDIVSKQEFYKISEEILSIEAEEPPIYRLLDVYCHNEMIKAYLPSGEPVKQKWYQVILKNYLRSM